MKTKPIKINVRLSNEEHAFLRTRSVTLFGGNLSQAVTSLIGEVNQGSQSSPPLASVLRKKKSAASTGQGVSSAFQG